ncbi:ppGpp synthetase catalytic domain-containing protein (RelA/SpoT-type nucleotidyltranferase) [Blastococcus tunisiensis]|uniref:PpGpp synthetase catalytic domain-containing protein (RelA/SpoT-type nucleotidyltranferase) n=1 Tax=Blastococcus tunisiensis TaxID=1798228 RepID=A0A1I2LRH3_9ACTN|nr:ppGpp synthetase catalytic domain-containing protein (RelA/SpoT-type nucleotidyltranferase) [Blastococcus sp. DSM 46838]
MVRIGAVKLPASKKKLSELGQRLASETLLPGDQELYVALLDTYDRVQQATRTVIEGVDWGPLLSGPLDVTGRTKTLDTLVQKLRRSPATKLPYVRDIAGVRVVGDFPLVVQTALATRLLTAFDEPDGVLIDRVAQPVSGYRAIHIVVRIDGIPVEVQIRTRLQHVWAEIYERVADRWGRQIRYGDPPDPEPLPREDGLTRQEIVGFLQRLSLEEIAECERAGILSFAVSEALRPGSVGAAVRPVLGLESDLEKLAEDRLTEWRTTSSEVVDRVQEVGAALEDTLLKVGELLDEEEPDHEIASSLEGP